MRRADAFIAAILITTIAAWSAAQQHENLERGFSPEKVYHAEDVDAVNLFNGNLTIMIPIGQSYPVNAGLSYSIGLSYNSNIWDYESYEVNENGNIVLRTRAFPNRKSNAGVGWTVSLGRLYQPNEVPYNNSNWWWLYVAPDGSEHFFYDTLHEGETHASGYYYTRDGSYIRLKVVPNWRCELHFPDGRVHTFGYKAALDSYTLDTIADPFGNSVSVFYSDPEYWQVVDMHGRTATINFNTVPWFSGQVHTIVVPASAGRTAYYSFGYTTTTIMRSTKDNDEETSTWVEVPLLTDLDLPDTSSYEMQYFTTDSDPDGTYGPSVGPDLPGVLRSLKLPTGGRISWLFNTIDIPSKCLRPSGDADNYVVAEPLAVTTRVTETWNGSTFAEYGRWDYLHSLHPSLNPLDKITVVTPPKANSTDATGNDSIYHFRTQRCTARIDDWDFGLPYTTQSESGSGRYLSAEHFAGAVAFDEPGGYTYSTSNRVRSVYASYDKDTLPPVPYPVRDTNRRMTYEKAVFHDDADSTTYTSNSWFDGLGHFRQTENGGSFLGSLPRTTVTDFNPNAGFYPGMFTLPSTSSPWLLTTYDYQTQQENGVTARQEFCFDTSTGFLRAKRTLVGTGQGVTDALALFTPDASGNVANEQYFGGDAGGIPSGYCFAPWVTMAGDQVRVDHTYQVGARQTSRYSNGSGVPLSFYTLDLDIDFNTGLASASHGASGGPKGEPGYDAGIVTNYEYDKLGRLLWEKPVSGHGAWIEHQYPVRSSSDYARVETFQRQNGSTTSVLARESLRFDDFARPFLAKQLLRSGAWNQRKTTYNALGWKVWVSELYPDGTADGSMSKMQYIYDSFGRPTTVTPPDGATHNVTFAYFGTRRVERTVKIATAVGTETSSTTAEEYDRQGRLAKVEEYSDPATPTTPVATVYRYDVGNRLSRACAVPSLQDPWCDDPTGPYPPQQRRLFTYDNRGYLLQEQLPEKGGINGNGTVSYSAYDARGHVGQVVDGPSTLTFAYDRAERPATVSEGCTPTPCTRTVKSYAYATANGSNNWKNGKLEQATAWSFYDGPGSANNLQAQENYTYGGKGGRVSAKSTTVTPSGAPQNAGTFAQSFTFNDLGLLATQSYPQKSGVGVARTVTNTYTNGFLSAVADGATTYASDISYHPNRMIDTVIHYIGVTTTVRELLGLDPNRMQRPASVAVKKKVGTTTTNLWLSGTYGYDGAGNVKAIGTDWYTYDLVSRLKEGTAGSTSKRQCATFNAFGAIVGLGTTTTGNCSPSGISVDASTNRLNYIPGSVEYDTAGNMTRWNSGTLKYEWYQSNQMRRYEDTSNQRVSFFGYTVDGERMGFFDSVIGGITYTVRGLDGKVLREVLESGGVWTWKKDYIYRDGQHLAVIDSAGTRHLHLDHLGTIRRITNSSGSLAYSHDYYPFGQEATNAYADQERMKYTGHERDLRDTTKTTDDLDYMHARYYNPNIARFLSVDPGRDVDPNIPQAWNLYAYVRGNPASTADPTGRWVALDPNASRSALGLVTKVLVQLAMRPSGRAMLSDLAGSAFGVGFSGGPLEVNRRAWNDYRSGRDARFAFGQTMRWIDHGTALGAKVTLDLDAIKGPGQRGHDPSGRTTVGHELDHVRDLMLGCSTATIRQADTTGMAEGVGQVVSGQQPDIGESAARQLVEQWLTQGAAMLELQKEPMVMLTSEASPKDPK